jgi:hypothetical protein
MNREAQAEHAKLAANLDAALARGEDAAGEWAALKEHLRANGGAGGFDPDAETVPTAAPTGTEEILAALAQALAEGDTATADDLSALLSDPAAASVILAELAEPDAAREQTRGAWVMRGGRAVRI